MNNTVAAAASMALVLGSLVSADTFVVDPTGGGDYLTVERAARWAPEGSTVLVTAGRYAGNIRIDGRSSLTIQAMDGAEVVLVPEEAGDALPVVSIFNSEGVTLRGMRIEDAATGGIWVAGSSATIEDCTVRDSFVTAVLVQSACGIVSFNNCEIGPNASAGLTLGDNASGQVYVRGSRIHSNNEIDRGGGIYGGGGFEYCELHIDDTEIYNNFASRGAGLHVTRNLDFVTIKNSVFRDNTAGNGGGIYINQSNYCHGVKIDDTRISSNHAQSVGGGLLVESTHGGTVKLTNCHIVENTADWVGGGACLRWCNEGLNFLVRDSEFLSNVSAEGGGGLHVDSIVPAHLRDSVFCGNLPEPIEGDWEGAGVLAVDTCSAGSCCLGSDCVQMSYAKCEDAGGRWGGVGIDCDKISCHGPIEGACCLGTYCVILMPEDCELHEGLFLGSGTLCVDSPTYCPKYSKADFDRNNKVDIDDLMKFFDYWGT
ncbi:MAG: right-handed parallel beta-helix repeat-containing protein [Phycisphaerales bacterium]|nr:right-handed parallel beta-helix repeat-containing protein [Phycisphaerales bacterium]